MFWKDKRVLVTGASGFVGPYLAKFLMEQEAHVIGQIRRRADGYLPKNLVEHGLRGLELIEADLTDMYGMASLLDRAKPDVVFHLAAQSFVQHSFTHPIQFLMANTIGTANLLEAIRIKKLDPIIVFAGSSEEYGLAISSQAQYQKAKEQYKVIYPELEKIPELPINENNPLRPMSPYAVSKVHGELLMRNYHQAYGLKTIISRGFNHEGAGRGRWFVTSAITRQIVQLKFQETDRIVVGNVNAMRDWSHVQDIVRGYCLLAEKGMPGEVYNQGSMRTNSVLSYILLSLEKAGWEIRRIRTLKGAHEIPDPTARDPQPFAGLAFEKTKVDQLMLEGRLEFDIEDKGIIVDTESKEVLIEFDPEKFRPAEVPILLCDASKIKKLGFETRYTLTDIIQDQLNYYLKPENRG